MKRIISALLCLLICMTSLSLPAFAAATNNDKEQCMKTAVALGLMQNDIVKRADTQISRGEFIQAVANLCGFSGSNVSVNVFSDLSKSSPYYSGITGAYENGIVSGYGDGTIRPEDSIQYTHAVVLLLKAVGYGELLSTGMDIGRAAAESDICGRGIAYNTNPLTVKDAAQLIMNAADSYMVEIETLGSEESDYGFGSETLLEKYKDIEKVQGVVTANGFTYLNDNGALSEEHVQIGEEIYLCGQSGVEFLLGYNVVAYYTDETILYAYEYNNEFLTISAEDIVGYSGGYLNYYNENEKIESEPLALASIDMIYNNSMVTVPKASDFLFENGYVTLIDYNHDSSYDVVVILDYRICVVDTVDKVNEVIFCKFGEAPIYFDENKRIDFTTPSNEKMYLVEIAQWDICAVAQSRDGKIMDVLYLTGDAEGTIESIESGEETKLVIDGAEYEVSQQCMLNQGDLVKIGTTAVFYFDINGRICAINDEAYRDENYGYLIKAYVSDKISAEKQVRMMDSSGNLIVLNLAEKVELDGDKLKVKDYKSTFNSLIPQVIIYKLNTAGEVNFIDTAYYIDEYGAVANLGTNESQENTLFKFYDGYTDNPVTHIPTPSETLQYKSSQKVFGGKVAASSATRIMNLPNDAQNADDIEYYVADVNIIGNDAKKSIRAYKRRQSAIAADVIAIYRNINNPETTAEDQAVTVFDKIVSVRQDDGEFYYKFSGYTGKNPVSYIVRDSDIIDSLKFKNAKYTLKRGDVVKVAVDIKGQMKACEVIYSHKKGEMSTANPNNADYLATTFRAMIANVYYVDKNNFITTTTTLLPNTDYSISQLETYETKNIDSFNIVLYDSENDILRTGNRDEIFGFINTNKAYSSKVFIHERKGDARTIVIYK